MYELLVIKLVCTLCVFAGYFVEGQSSNHNVFLTPTTDSKVITGQPFEIRWRNLAGRTVDLVLFNFSSPGNRVYDDSTYLALDLVNVGSYIWNVPNSPPGGPYKISIINRRGTLTSQISEEFNISTEASPSSRLPVAATTLVPRVLSAVADPSISASFITANETVPIPQITSNSTTTSIIPGPTSPPPSQSKTVSTGTIVGAAMGGFVFLLSSSLLAMWYIGKGRKQRHGKADLPNIPLPPDMNNQSIWDGRATYSYNPTRATPDIYPGQGDPSRDVGGGAVAPASEWRGR
ncbi:hypothetical protein TWF730_004192 [Orbilia blumenaviensis]|uniref:Yeast cell wall synthesis Kre9/Knh1-like N-terminal domain-containing protein n=1 Tax=Orbilia blumenaviensis TaxID=1796055 RepID=A0AAV9U3U6_9PEZI